MTTRDKLLEFWDKHDYTAQKKLIAGPVDWEQSERDAVGHCRLIVTPLIKAALPKEPVVLEIGCGVGRLLKVLSGPKYKYTTMGLDLSPAMINKAKDYLKDIKPPPHLEVITDDIPAKDGSIDLVFSFLVFQHIQTAAEVEKYITDSLRALKPGGFLRVQTHKGQPCPENMFGGFHGRFYPSLEAFAAEYVRPDTEVVEQSEGQGHPDWLWVTVRKNA